MLKSAQKCLKVPTQKVLSTFSKKCLVLKKEEVLSTFQRTFYTYSLCVKSPGKVLETFCPKISERRKYLKCVQIRKFFVGTTLLSHGQ